MVLDEMDITILEDRGVLMFDWDHTAVTVCGVPTWSVQAFA